jgi:hypothetical protein
MGNPNAISLGPGTLRIADLGSTEPTDLTTGWVAAWVDLGYTFEGSEFAYQLNVDPVEVAEELDPIRYAPTGRTIMVRFTLAEITATNLKRALNGGTITTGSGFVTYDPPAFGTETRKMYGWESNDAQERWVFRQCLSSGTVETARRKGADKAGFPFELNCEKPAGVQPFKVIMASPARA